MLKVGKAFSKFGNLIAENKTATKTAGIVLLVGGTAVALFSCNKDCKYKGQTKEGYTLDEANCEWIKNPEPENCDGQQNTYDLAAGKATSDSTAYVDYKDTAPDPVLSSVKSKMGQGMTEEEAWDWSINNFITNPNAPQALKEWAEAYQNYLDSFNKSIKERDAALKSLIECQQRLIKQ